MVARLALTNPDNVGSSGPITHISGLDFTSSHHASESIRDGSGTGGVQFNSSVRVEEQEKSQVVRLDRESNSFEMLGDNQAQV